MRNGGLKAYTTIDPELQECAQEAVDSCGVCYPEGGPAAGLASVDPETGEIVALASTEGYASESQFNYAWQAHRQPGSSFKTFVLAAAIKEGIDPDSTYYDGSSPKTLDLPYGGTWTVNNSEPGGGTMSLASATWHSVNVIFAQLDIDVGPEEVTKTAEEMGITSPLESVPAEGIGGLAVGVTPLEMADAYATLANGGIHHDATAIDRVEFPDGKVDETSPDDGERVLSEGEAYEVTRLLEGVITQGTGAGYTYMGCSAAAGKTGTSEDTSDAWFVGYTPLYSTAVWVGHPQSREPTGYGGPTAGPIWRSLHGICGRRRLPGILGALEPAGARRARQRQHLLVLGRIRIRIQRRSRRGALEERRRGFLGRGRSGTRAGSRPRSGARTSAGARTRSRAAAQHRRRRRQPALTPARLARVSPLAF